MKKVIIKAVCLNCNIEFISRKNRERKYCSHKCSSQKRTTPLKIRLFNHCSIQNNCIVWNGALNERGYGLININRTKGTTSTHRAAWFIHYGSFPKNLVLHTCDVRNCVNINHLKEGTAQDNTDDMMRKNRYKMPTLRKGSQNANSVLNEELVLQIKKLLKEGKSVAEVSRVFQQPFTRIYDIKRQKTWKHIDVDMFSDKKYKFIPAIGSKASGAKLNETQVIEIKKLLKTGIMQKKIAELFNIRKNHVSNINTGKYWSHIV
jgi:predicted XRE-type DNA-binding protein